MSSQNLKKRLDHLTLIEDWWEARTGTASRLDNLFYVALGQNNVFASIYVAIRENPQSSSSTEIFNYYNVGFTSTEIAAYFNAKYGLNYFAYDYNIEDDYLTLKAIMSSIYEANRYKYMKLIEVLGYQYNPLYNVDGVELYARGESIGDNKSERKPEGTVTSTTGKKDGSNITDSESVYYKNPYNENSESASVVDSKTKQSPLTTVQSYSEDYQETTEFKNIPADNYKYNSTSGQWEKDGLFSIAAKDNAFGVAFNGPERYYAEKRIRQGNIGVTKSTELLEAQRELVRFNILDDFFEDLYEHIVVGIY